jgi:hypothetical protein
LQDQASNGHSIEAKAPWSQDDDSQDDLVLEDQASGGHYIEAKAP